MKKILIASIVFVCLAFGLALYEESRPVPASLPEAVVDRIVTEASAKTTTNQNSSVASASINRPEIISDTDRVLGQFCLSSKNLIGIRPVAQKVPPIRVPNNLQKQQ